uniref:Uncharacterized protein n=1 Tax=viral metagenome TaxID=1070528 RepID=A0A6C0L0W8_9ZZZZ|tara:strand:+ start:13680 stop:14180 length:501 start_codon:yes stop_codon:yes gene_type:complete
MSGERNNFFEGDQWNDPIRDALMTDEEYREFHSDDTEELNKGSVKEIPGYLGRKTYSSIANPSESILNEKRPQQKETIADLSFKQIMSNMSDFINNFNKEVSYKVKKAEYEMDIQGDGFVQSIKKYIFGIVLHISDKDNTIYFGIILIILSIIIYFFNISRDDQIT